MIQSGSPATAVKVPESYLELGWLQHAYAVTINISQGVTLGRSFILGSEAMYREAGYTAASRARNESRFYVTRDLPEQEGGNHQSFPVDSRAEKDSLGAEFEETLQQSRAKDLALNTPSDYDPSYG